MSLKILIFIFPAMASFIQSCSTQTVWDIDAGQFMDRLFHRRWEFLHHINYDEADISEIELLGAGSGFYLSYIFRELGNEEMTERMLMYEGSNGTGSYRREARELLIRDLISAGRYEEAVRESEFYIRDYPDLYFGHRRLLEAHYRLAHNGRVLELIDRIEEEFPEKRSTDHEIDLYHTVTLYRAGMYGWEEGFVNLFAYVPAAGLHIRAYRYLDDFPSRMEPFTDEEVLLFRSRVWHITGNRVEAADGYAGLLAAGSGLMESAVLLEEAADSFIAAGRLTEGAETLLLFIEGREKLRDRGLYAAWFARGKVLRAAENYTGAFECFRIAEAYAGETTRERDRALWYGLSSRLDEDHPDLFAEEARYAAFRWEDPAYFSDLFERAASRLIREDEWFLLWDLYHLLREKGKSDIAVRYGYICLRGVEEGYFSIPSDGRDYDIGMLEEDILSLQNRGYYHTVVTLKRGDRPPLLSELMDLNPEPDGEGDTGVQPYEDDVAFGFLRFGLMDNGLEFLRKNRGRITMSGLYSLAEEFSRQGEFRKAIITCNMVLGRNGSRWNARLRDLCYPRAYIQEIMDQSREYIIPWYLLAALVREESSFDADAVSHAGAVGLTQLMPSTAREVSEKIGIERPELTDPATNLSLGARYFSDLIRRFEWNPLLAVCAYNAGPSRVRAWQREGSSLPGDLFLETVPFEETRNHGKKVLLSSLVYGTAYGDESALELLTEYFGGLSRTD